MGFGDWSRVEGLGFGVWGLGFGVWGLGFGVWGWCGDQGLEFEDWGLGIGDGFWVSFFCFFVFCCCLCFGSGVLGLVFRVWGVEFRVEGLRLKV